MEVIAATMSTFALVLALKYLGLIGIPIWFVYSLVICRE
jgi:hypothetical protein